MKNIHASDGMAEDLIRSFTQIASAELHVKTLLEKRISELENGMVKESDTEDHINAIDSLEEELETYADIRRKEMLKLYELYGNNGDKEQWCLVKHLSMAMYTVFESYQASDKDEELLTLYLRINKQFIKVLTKFLGVEITECASCFSDILKAGESNETNSL